MGDIFNPEITAIETSWDHNQMTIQVKNKVEELKSINIKKILVVNYVIKEFSQLMNEHQTKTLRMLLSDLVGKIFIT